MKLILLFFLYFLTGCATKYIIPGNRFISPESQGGVLRGQFEYQQPGATQLTIDTDNVTVDDGVKYSEVSRSGFLASTSVFDKFDFIWSHTGGSNSLIGPKFQFIGEPRTTKGAGHKASAAALFGSNEHETEDETVDFTLGGKEFLLLYGYRITENIMPYASFSYAVYTFNGKINSSGSPLDGLEPELETTSKALNGGLELSFDSFFTKLEATYQQLSTTDTKDKTRFMFGYSIGISW